jgi:hypothetical protein
MTHFTTQMSCIPPFSISDVELEVEISLALTSLPLLARVGFEMGIREEKLKDSKVALSEVPRNNNPSDFLRRDSQISDHMANCSQMFRVYLAAPAQPHSIEKRFRRRQRVEVLKSARNARTHWL